MRAKKFLEVFLFWLTLTLIVAHAHAQTPRVRQQGAFQPSRRIFAQLFPADPRRRLRPIAPPPTSARQIPANRTCDGCDARPGTVHLVLDSPRLTDVWLAQHTYQANGGSFGDNMAIADFWYDAVHRRVFSRSLVLQEVDDPADLRLGRAPGVYPNEVNTDATLAEDTTVGHVGFVPWGHNGFGAYFAAVQGAVRRAGTGYLDLSTTTGEKGQRRTGSSYTGEDLVKHVRLHPSGQLEVGFETDPDTRPDPLLLVRGDERVEGSLTVNGSAHVGALSADGLTVRGVGGNVPHACELRSGNANGRSATASCGGGQIAIAGGGTCGSGEMRGSRPLQAGEMPNGWELTCSKSAEHSAYVICCSR